VNNDPPHSPGGEIDQQVRLWLGRAHDAYARRLIPRALHYFQRALDYAEERGLQRETALICRDLGYVYRREGGLKQAMMFLDHGLAVSEGLGLPVRVGLLANKALVFARLESYRASLTVLEEAAALIRANYGNLAEAPTQLGHSYAGLQRMAGDLRRVVDLLDMGIKPERLEVEIRSEEPPWLTRKD
jgi:tetratricopeptide (TPR) repeat protein